MQQHRVLHVIGGGEIGGAERHVLSLLTGLEQYGYLPSLICLCQGPFCQKAAECGIVAETIEMKGKLDITKVAPLRDYMRQHKIDIVHTHGVRANLVARKAAKSLGLPVVTTFHSAVSHDYSSRLAAIVAGVITKSTNKHTDEFIAISDSIRADVLQMQVNPDIVTTIYNGVDFSGAPADSRSRWRSRLGIAENETVVGMVARLHEVKGHVYLFEALNAIRKDMPDIKLVLVGEGPLRESLEVKISELDLQNNVIMTGFIENLRGIYQAFDVACLPSLMEGMGITLLEAMHEGTPVLASNVGGIPELVRNGIDGLLVEPANPEEIAEGLKKLLGDSELRKKIAESAKGRAEKFSRPVMLSSTANIYDRLLERNGRFE